MARWWNPSANSNSNVTSAWSATKGGPTGASVPGINDDVHFTSGNNKNCTINANHIWKSVTFDEDSGYSGQLSMSGIRYINVNGNFILSSAMTFGATIPDLSFGGTTYNIDFKGKTWKNQVSISNNQQSILAYQLMVNQSSNSIRVKPKNPKLDLLFQAKKIWKSLMCIPTKGLLVPISTVRL